MPIESGKICNVLPRPADSNGLMVAKLKRGLKYWGNVYFEPIRPFVICQALDYFNHITSFTKTFLFQKVCQATKY